MAVGAGGAFGRSESQETCPRARQAIAALAFSLRARERKADMTDSRRNGELSLQRSFTRVVAVLIALGILAGLLASGLLGGCARESFTCGEGFSRCALACADLTSDAANCGGCGVACKAGELCQSGRCQCPPGATLCGSACVVTASDPANCGGCAGIGAGQACWTNEVCELGQCQTRCVSPGSTQCGRSCVNLASDVNNCGACDHPCRDAQSCHSGRCTYDIVAACFNTGQVVGVQGETDLQSTRARVGSFPQALGSLDDVLLVGDGIDQRLRQARLDDFSPLPGEVRLGASPNHIWVDDPLIYVVNSLGNTLQILQRQTSLANSGLQLSTIGEVNFGPVSSPQAVAFIGNDAYLPFWSGPGQVVRVDVANPRAPVVTRVFDLRDLDLQPFDGGTTYARPGAVAVAWGKVYVALQNLDPRASPGGPGILAKIDPVSESVTAINLGADVCLNAFWLSAADDALYVSCAGKIIYGPGYQPLAVDKSGVVVLNEREERVSTWNVACAPGSAGCIPPSVGRFAIFNHRLYLGDQAGGRVFVVESLGDHQLIERRGHNPVNGGPPLLVCPRDAGMLSLVIDVIAVP